MQKVSVIVPVYNVEQYLERCFNSIIQQTYTDLEIILVDDGSPDNSGKLCDKLAKKDNRVKVIHKENGGLSSARLAGVKCATGEYCVFVDSDDYIDRDMVEVLYSACVSNNADMSICSWYTHSFGEKITQNKLQIEDTIIDKSDIIEKYFLPELSYLPTTGAINIPAFLCIRCTRRSVLSEEIFVSERDYITEDILMQQLLSFKINKIAIVNEPKYHYCFNKSSLTNKYRSDVFGRLMARYFFSYNLCKEHDLLDKARERMHFNLLSVVGFSVLNACKLSRYSDSKLELKTIFSNKEVIDMFHTIDTSGFSLQQRVIYYCYRLGTYYLLYRYLRWRMNM